MKKIEKNGKYVEWHLMKNRSSAVLSPNISKKSGEILRKYSKKGVVVNTAVSNMMKIIFVLFQEAD